MNIDTPKIDLEPLYWALTNEFEHPAQWMHVLSPPPWYSFWKARWRDYHKRVKAIFVAHGFKLTPEVARRFGSNPDRWEAYGLGAGGAIICDLAYALQNQTHIHWRGYL